MKPRPVITLVTGTLILWGVVVWLLAGFGVWKVIELL